MMLVFIFFGGLKILATWAPPNDLYQAAFNMLYPFICIILIFLIALLMFIYVDDLKGIYYEYRRVYWINGHNFCFFEN
jgi:hypothetical protein